MLLYISLRNKRTYAKTLKVGWKVEDVYVCVLLNTFPQQERASSKNDVSVSAVSAGSGISGTAQSERNSHESKSVLKDVKDDDIDAHLKAYEQALGTEKALQFEQFQVEDEEMAPEALVGKKRRKKTENAIRTEVRMEDEMEEESRGAKHAQWMSMFGIRVCPKRVRRTEAELLLDASEQLAEDLRDHVTMPADPKNSEVSLQDAQSGGWLPPASCAFRRCTWCVAAKASSKSSYEDDPEHPWDQDLRAHVASAHSPAIQSLVSGIVGPEKAKQFEWDIYKEACSVQERRTIPVTGPSVERRTCERTAHVYNDECVRALICFACARVKVDTGRIRSDIAFRTGEWLFSLPPGSLVKNFPCRNSQDDILLQIVDTDPTMLSVRTSPIGS